MDITDKPKLTGNPIKELQNYINACGNITLEEILLANPDMSASKRLMVSRYYYRIVTQTLFPKLVNEIGLKQGSLSAQLYNLIKHKDLGVTAISTVLGLPKSSITAMLAQYVTADLIKVRTKYCEKVYSCNNFKQGYNVRATKSILKHYFTRRSSDFEKQNTLPGNVLTKLIADGKINPSSLSAGNILDVESLFSTKPIKRKSSKSKDLIDKKEDNKVISIAQVKESVKEETPELKVKKAELKGTTAKKVVKDKPTNEQIGLEAIVEKPAKEIAKPTKKQLNQKPHVKLEVMLATNSMTIPEIMEATNLSRKEVKSLLEEMVKSNLVDTIRGPIQRIVNGKVQKSVGNKWMLKRTK